MATTSKPTALPTPSQELGPRWEVAQAMLQQLKPERYVYLTFCALGAVGVLVALAMLLRKEGFKLAEISMLSGSGGVIALTGSRILTIQKDLFRVVFGIQL